MECTQTWRWGVVVMLAMSWTAVRGEDLRIQSFDKSGRLTFTEITTAAVYVVESAATPTGGWTTAMASRAPANGMNMESNRLSACFYRVVAGVTNSVVPEPSGMVLIPAGNFQMGNAMAPNEGLDWELPVHTVYISAFYMDRTEVSKAKWDEVYTWAVTNGYSFDNIGSGKASIHPAGNVNWYDTLKWCNALSQMEGKAPAYYTSSTKTTENLYKTGQVKIQNDWVRWDTGYRLPTEAEWEKAARGGLSGKRFPWGNLIDHTRANYFSYRSYLAYDLGYKGFDSRYATDYPYTSPVASFAPNGYGLYDMTGNVWEWCWDYLDYYPTDRATDPHGASRGSTRVYRGGRWNDSAEECRVAFRNGDWPDYTVDSIGFRAVLPQGQQ